MKHIGNLKKAVGSTHSKKRIGRGEGSGHGGTSGKGHKGQKSRTGAKIRRGFEGGQMPMNRRVPKFGFTNIFRKEYSIVNVADLQALVDEKRIDPNNVDKNALIEAGIIKKKSLPLKVLGGGEVSAELKVKANKFSDSAKEKIEKAGGAVTIDG